MTRPTCQPIHTFPAAAARKLTYFFTDIDDTLSSDGQITSMAYQAVWELHQAGIKVVPVTGRPAGWCDMIARMWPVEAVIGENGAFYFHYDRTSRRMIREFFQTEDQRREGKRRLAELQHQVLEQVPGCDISADQPYRIADLAIDFCEDVDPLDDQSIAKICELATDLSLTWKVSSIHVNCWYGEFDKVTCLKKFLAKHCETTLKHFQNSMVYIGDSPNDEPMFAEVENSIAVANINRFLDSLDHLPAYITTSPSGQGFQEAVRHILRSQV